MSKIQSLQYLLSSVSEINKKYQEIACITGENFNIFSILKLQTDEVRLHSRLLGELLNPDGSHGRNEIFLELFLSTLNLKNEYTSEQIKKASVIVEENIGNIPDDYSKGGRIDLVIKFTGNKEIVIENKIYAADQPNQLGRYHEQYPNAYILYLTPLERKPSDFSIGENLKREDIKLITYKNEIKEWLELCHEKTSNFPMLRETITQYIYLIKHLTNQTMNEQNENEIIKLLLESENNYNSANSISNSFSFIRNIPLDFYNSFEEKWKQKYLTREVKLFRYKEYIFYIKPSYENNYFHFDLYPLKNNTLGFADETELLAFRNLAMEFEGRPINKDEFYSNRNYTVWVWSKNIRNFDFANLKSLYSNQLEYMNRTMDEGANFINYMIYRLKELNDLEIEIYNI